MTGCLEEHFNLGLQIPDNVWIGTTVESSKYLDRIDKLRIIPAKTRFLSFEPLLSSMKNIDLTGIHWVIVGGESGPKSRPMKKEWVLNIQNQCKEQNVPFFFKQWGGKNKKKAGKLINGKIYQEWPKIVDG